MKIGINARTFSVDEPGGAVQAAMMQAKELSARNDTEVVLFGHKSIRDDFPELTVVSDNYISSSQAFGILWERTSLPKLASSQEVDVLYCPNGNAPLTSISVPTVVCIHDVNAIKRMSSNIHYIYRRLTIPSSVNSAEVVTTVSEFSKKEITSELSIDEGNISVVHNGISDYYLNDGPGKPLDLPDEYILYVGSMNPRKNIQGILDSFNILKDSMEEYKLVMIGPENKSIFKNFEVKDSDNIVTPGYVSIEELKFAYKNAAVFLYPSKYEGFGLPPIEAMACGTPVIASRTASLPEVLDDAPMYVDPKDPRDIAETTQTVLENPKLSSQLVERGFIQASKYTWENSASRLMDVFHTL
ncbi:glycosyltransferase [Haloferax prahovense]|uniref:glycosyltransferase n=1 Tax=Haloferax prahovense TaxID=381852 RepID=UPI0009DEC0FF|nr:glycosyltransferase family 1 protein [Haloferax prahovense]